MPGSFLVAIDDVSHRDDVLRGLSTRGVRGVDIGWDSLHDHSVDEAVRGAIVEIDTEAHDHKLEKLRALRRPHPKLPLLAIVATPTKKLLDELHLLDADVCVKPVAEPNLERFAHRAIARGPLDVESVRRRLRDATEGTSLSRRETEVLLYATQGMPRRELAERLGVSENTVKAQIRSLLRKTGARSVAVLAQRVLKSDGHAHAG